MVSAEDGKGSGAVEMLDVMEVEDPIVSDEDVEMHDEGGRM